MKANSPFDFFFQWHLTERCNLKCLHCYQEGKPTHEMNIEEIKRTVAILSETINRWSELYEIPFATSINITGGEPFIRSDLSEILTALREHDFNLYILTNGTLVHERDAALLDERKVKGVQVSLEGPEKVHDHIRGKGSFQSAIRGVKHLLSRNLPVTLNLTLSALNVGHIEEMAVLASSLGVQRLGFSRLVPSGRGMGLLDSMLSKEMLREAYDKIHSLEIDDLDIVTGDPVYSWAMDKVSPEDSAIAFGGCTAGVSGLTILPDGTLVPCRRLNIPLGNILTDDLRTVWAASPVLDGLRDKEKYQGKCRTCVRWAQCRGCRAIAYQYSLLRGKGNYLSEDPQCFLNE